MIIHSILLFLASVCSMSYELLISRVFFELGFDETLSLTTPIGFYLLGMGLGTIAVKKTNLYTQLFKTEFILVMLGCIVPFLLMSLHLSLVTFFYNSDSKIILNIEFFLLQIFPFLVGFYSGKELQNFFFLFEENKIKGFGFTLALSYLGSLVAGLGIPILISSKISPLYASIVIAALNLYILILFYFEAQTRKLIKSLLLLTAFITLGLSLLTAKSFENFTVKALYSDYKSAFVNVDSIKGFILSTKNTKAVKRTRTRYQVIDTIPRDFIKASTGFSSPFTVYLNLKPQFDSESYKGYHQTMVIGSKNLAKVTKLKNILVLGGGDGLLNDEILSRFPNLDSITQIELDPKMIAFASTHPEFLQLNNNSFNNPKVHVVFMDALTYLRNTKKKFDAIFIDLPLPSTLDLSKLYTKEFYLLAIKRLNKKGFFVFDVPTLNEKLNPKDKTILKNKKILFATLLSTKCSNINFFGPLEAFGFCQPNKEQTHFDYSKLATENMDSSVYVNMIELKPPKLSEYEKLNLVNSIFKLKGFDVP